MKVLRVEVENIKCFTKVEIDLSPGINVIVGPNNNGKTTLLNCISILQQPRLMDSNSRRIGADTDSIRIYVDKTEVAGLPQHANTFTASTMLPELHVQWTDGQSSSFGGILNQEPDNFIIPYCSNRKVAVYNERIELPYLKPVSGTLQNLYAKVDRICNPEYLPAYNEYIAACDEILGFRVSTISSDVGKKAAYIIRNDQNIHIDMMGEGIANLLGLIVDLCRAENKLFIIEEPESDIHPKALKKLLDLIIKKSESNQFVITTHSNIVLKHLGSQETTKVFNIEMELVDRVPTSIINLVDTPEKRRIALEELGYDLFDFELWTCWLFLEESSAERIIRDYLIPWFVPELKGKIRTFSARTISQVAPKFDDFNRLFVFLHLQEIYKNKAWVIVDGGEEELKILDELRLQYEAVGWKESNFKQFQEHDFEKYYPVQFQGQVKLAIEEANKNQKRERKKNLLTDLINYIKADEEKAKTEFQQSASEVIGFLTSISQKV